MAGEMTPIKSEFSMDEEKEKELDAINKQDEALTNNAVKAKVMRPNEAVRKQEEAEMADSFNTEGF